MDESISLNLNLNMFTDTNRTPYETVIGDSERADLAFHDMAEAFYAYMTPIIVIVGIVGNALSMRVFTSKVSACQKEEGGY